MRRLRTAVIGLGVGEAHAEAYAAHPQCDLVVVCELSAEKLERAARRFPGVRTTDDAGAVLADPTIDLVSIASFDDAHFEQAVRGLEAGKHIFVEKPLCRSVDELRALRSVWERSRTAVGSNLVLREAPLYAWVAAAARRGELGRIYAFDGDYLYGRIEKVATGWRKDVDQYSVMQGGGIHLIDLMLWITGERPVSAFALGSRIATAETAFRYQDMIAASYRFTSGLVGRVTANFGCVHPHQHVVRVFGTAATFLHDDRGPRLRTSRDPTDAGQPLHLAAEPARKGALLSRFVDAILRGRYSEADLRRELDVVSVAVAADEAVRSGSEVAVTYV